MSPPSTDATYPIEGGCDCRAIRYRMKTAPMIVHSCHCRWCQRESGTAFALNAVIEADRVELVAGQPECVSTPSASGKGQNIWRCPTCRVAVWSNYAGSGELSRFVRVGTLDNPDLLPPDVFIFTSTKQPWVVLPASIPAFADFYNPKEVWSPDAQARFLMMKAKAGARA
jgi:hypothetical protein